MKKLLKLALVVAVIVAIAKAVETLKSDWSGLTESAFREKLIAKMGDRVPEEQRDEILEKIVEGMKEKGWLVEEAV